MIMDVLELNKILTESIKKIEEELLTISVDTTKYSFEDIVSFDEYNNVDTDVRGAKGEIFEYLTAKSKYMAVRLRRSAGKR